MTQSQLSAARHNDAQAEGPWAAWRDEDLLAAYARENTHEAFEELFHRYEGLLRLPSPIPGRRRFGRRRLSGHLSGSPPSLPRVRPAAKVQALGFTALPPRERSICCGETAGISRSVLTAGGKAGMAAVASGRPTTARFAGPAAARAIGTDREPAAAQGLGRFAPRSAAERGGPGHVSRSRLPGGRRCVGDSCAAQ